MGEALITRRGIEDGLDVLGNDPNRGDSYQCAGTYTPGPSELTLSNGATRTVKSFVYMDSNKNLVRCANLDFIILYMQGTASSKYWYYTAKINLGETKYVEPVDGYEMNITLDRDTTDSTESYSITITATNNTGSHSQIYRPYSYIYVGSN